MANNKFAKLASNIRKLAKKEKIKIKLNIDKPDNVIMVKMSEKDLDFFSYLLERRMKLNYDDGMVGEYHSMYKGNIQIHLES